MAENGIKFKCCPNLIGVLDYFVLIITLVVSLCELLASKSISPVFVGIVVTIGLLIGALCLMYCFNSKCMGNDHLLNVIIFCIRLWCGCVLGLMSFVDISAIQNDVSKTAITLMLPLSIGIKAIWSIGQRYYGLTKYSSSPVTWAEILELVGFSVTGLIVLPEEQAFFSKYALFLILVSFAFTVVALRLVAFFNPFIMMILGSFTVCQVVFFSTVDLPINGVALGCFAGRLFVDPVFDLVFSNISFEQRLNSVFSIHGCFQKMFILIVIVFEVIFPFHSGISIIYHNEWYWIFLFVLLLLFWIGLHSYFIPLCWYFSNKMSECIKAFQVLRACNTRTSMDKMMATKGMRLQAQLAYWLMNNTFGSTLFLGIATLAIPSGTPPSHQDEKAALAASCLIVLLVEGMFFAATDTLRKSLSGACTAYVIMPPSSSHGQSELIHSGQLRKSIMDFFESNAIPCSIESVITGLSVTTLRERLKLFFQQTIPDTNGQRYDSYVVFYCGDVDGDGKWELTAGKFQFEMMQLLWNSCNTKDFQSRLILIQDAKCSKDWLKKIANDKTNVIAMQTCKLSGSRDLETGSVARVGDFTGDWIKFNRSPENSINWKERGRKVKAVYGISPSWIDNDFHVPNEKDMKEYASKFPQKLKCLVELLLYPAKFKEQTIFYTHWKRFTMNWFPPSSIDTGHGFKLVKS